MYRRETLSVYRNVESKILGSIFIVILYNWPFLHYVPKLIYTETYYKPTFRDSLHAIAKAPKFFLVSLPVPSSTLYTA